MDLVQIGKFIAQLRKEHGFSQEKLGEMLGVTNKTISRWETGTYLPPAEMLVSMSNLFHVTINELLSGKRLTQDEYKIAAEENLRQVVKASSFTLKEKIAFYKKKVVERTYCSHVLLGHRNYHSSRSGHYFKLTYSRFSRYVVAFGRTRLEK